MKEILFLLKNKSFNLIEGFLYKNNAKGPVFGNYVFIKDLRKSKDKTHHNIGLYKNIRTGKKNVIRTLDYKLKSTEYFQIVNEAKVLKLLNRLSKQKKNIFINFPNLIKFEDKRGRLVLIREYKKGLTINKLKNKKQILEVLNKCLVSLQNLSDKNLVYNKTFSQRTPLMIFTAFPLYILQAAIKNPNKIRLIFRLSAAFYKSFLYPNSFKPVMVLSHRDLHQDNILISNNTISIIDNEIMLLAERETDLAFVARYYLDTLGLSGTLDLLDSQLYTQQEIDRFIRLAIFYSIQLLTTVSSNHPFYNLTLIFLDTFIDNIYPVLISKRNLSKNPILDIY